MKTIFIICGLILLGGSGYLWKSMQKPSIYGDFVGVPKVEVMELIEHPEAYLTKTVYIEGTITKQCTSMGCYFFFHEGMKELRVDLEQIAMYAPRNKNGHLARVEGRMIPYNGDYEFMASAVEFK